jgi:hypothetical protein
MYVYIGLCSHVFRISQVKCEDRIYVGDEETDEHKKLDNFDE